MPPPPYTFTHDFHSAQDPPITLFTCIEESDFYFTVYTSSNSLYLTCSLLLFINVSKVPRSLSQSTLHSDRFHSRTRWTRTFHTLHFLIVKVGSIFNFNNFCTCIFSPLHPSLSLQHFAELKFRL